MKLLIDADFIVYKACAAAEEDFDFGDDVIIVVSRFAEAYKNVTNELSRIKAEFMWDVPEMILFFSDSQNFRKKFTPVTRVIEIEKSPVDTNVSSQSLRRTTK